MSEDASSLAPSPSDAQTPASDSALPRTQFSWPATWLLIASFAAMGAALGPIVAGRAASGLFLPSLTIVICLVAAWHDAATSRIPNQLTYTAILLGLGLNALAAGLQVGHFDLAVRWLGGVGPIQSLEGFGLCAGLGLFALAVAGMGGGDAKLLAALGALAGFQQACAILSFAFAAAALYAAINLIIVGRLNHAIRGAALWLLDLVYLARPQKIVAVQRSTIPLAVPLLVGLVLSQTALQRVMMKWIGF